MNFPLLPLPQGFLGASRELALLHEYASGFAGVLLAACGLLLLGVSGAVGLYNKPTKRLTAWGMFLLSTGLLCASIGLYFVPLAVITLIWRALVCAYSQSLSH